MCSIKAWAFFSAGWCIPWVDLMGAEKDGGRIFGSKNTRAKASENTRSRSCRVFLEAAHALVDVPATGILVVNQQAKNTRAGSKILRVQNTPC